MEVLEGQNILVTISGKKNRVRVYYLSWLKSKILRTDGLSDVSFKLGTLTIQFNIICTHSKWSVATVGLTWVIYKVLYILRLSNTRGLSS